MYRAPFFAVAALALAILAPSGPSHGADLSGSESEVQHKCVQRNAARQLSEDYRSRLLEIREIGSERRSDLINQRYTSVHEAAKLIMEKWNRFLAERKRQFYTDLAGIGKKIQEAAKAPDETRPIQYLEGRKQTVRVYLDDVHELKGGRTQEVRTTRDEIRACYRTQLDETKEAWDLARRTLAAQYWEVRQRIYSAPLESIGDSESEVGQLLAQGKPVSVDSIAPPENLIAAYDSKNGGAIGAVEALEGGEPGSNETDRACRSRSAPLFTRMTLW